MIVVVVGIIIFVILPPSLVSVLIFVETELFSAPPVANSGYFDSRLYSIYYFPGVHCRHKYVNVKSLKRVALKISQEMRTETHISDFVEESGP